MVRLCVNSGLLAAKFWGPKVLCGFSTVQGVRAPVPILFKGQLYITTLEKFLVLPKLSQS